MPTIMAFNPQLLDICFDLGSLAGLGKPEVERNVNPADRGNLAPLSLRNDLLHPLYSFPLSVVLATIVSFGVSSEGFYQKTQMLPDA